MTLGRLLRADAPAATALIRLAVGVVFASEGIQKFLYADAQGAGRFARIGIPAPEVMGPFVGVVEVVCGSLVLVGLATRLAALPLVIDMLVAIASTKVPILLGHGYWIFAHTFAPKAGFWALLHESRTDLAMLCGSIFLVLVGADRASLDARLGTPTAAHPARRSREPRHTSTPPSSGSRGRRPDDTRRASSPGSAPMSEAPAGDGRDDEAPVEPQRPTAQGLLEVASAFLRLGCLSFGGPIAHLGYLRAELVEKRRWLDDAHYGDLVALCQFLPGPASSQVVFALGMQRAGLAGALVASACFTLPSALLMIGFAYGVARASDLSGAGWLHGLKLAAVAVVAQAVWGMGKKLCTDRARISLCLGSAAVLLAMPGAIAQLGVIALGGLVGWWLHRDTIAVGSMPAAGTGPTGTRGHVAAAAALVVFLALLFALPALASATGSRDVAVFDSFYRSGSLVFGGGHVVLPLLRAEVVPRGWLTDDQFLAGYGAAQALPGPMFAFSAYLGAAMRPGPTSWLGGLWCLLGIFLPAWLLIGGALPFWHRLRAKRWAQAALAGANATVVGVLLAALYDPVFTESVRGPRDVVAALLAFGLLEHWRAPPWLVVAASAATGQWLLTT